MRRDWNYRERHSRSWCLVIRTLWTGFVVLERVMGHRLPDSWFVGIEDRYVNELARMSRSVRLLSDGEVDGHIAQMLFRACRERDRRYPARVGLPQSMAIRWK